MQVFERNPLMGAGIVAFRSGWGGGSAGGCASIQGTAVKF